MEKPEKEIEETHEVDALQEERDELPLFWGIFSLSRYERIMHAAIITLIGTSYVAFIIWNSKSKIEQVVQLSGIQVIPCLILSLWLVRSAWPLSEVKDQPSSVYFTRVFLRLALSILWVFIYVNLIPIIFNIMYKYLPA